MTDQLIAFCKPVVLFGGTDQIFVCNPDGTDLTQITPGSNGYDSVRFNPIGGNVAATDGVGRLFLIDAGGTETQITNLPSGSYVRSQPAWSPDGTKIALPNPGAGGDIAVISADNSGFTLVSVEDDDFNFTELCWSPDGTKFAFTNFNNDNDFLGVSVCDIDGSSEIEIVGGTTPNSYRVWDWYPDSAHILVARINEAGGDDITLLKYDLGGGSTVVYDDPTGLTIATNGNSAVSVDGELVSYINQDDPASAITVLSDGTGTDLGPGIEDVSAFGHSWGFFLGPQPVPPVGPGFGTPGAIVSGTNRRPRSKLSGNVFGSPAKGG